MPFSRHMNRNWGVVDGMCSRTYDELSLARHSNPLMVGLRVSSIVSDEDLAENSWPLYEYTGFEIMASMYDPASMSTHVRGDMNRQGVVTEAGVTAFENDGEIQGSLAIKVNMDDDGLAKLDLRIVNDVGETLTEWEGVDVIDGSQVTWCFSDTGNIRITMDPVIDDAA